MLCSMEKGKKYLVFPASFTCHLGKERFILLGSFILSRKNACIRPLRSRVVRQPALKQLFCLVGGRASVYTALL